MTCPPGYTIHTRESQRGQRDATGMGSRATTRRVRQSDDSALVGRADDLHLETAFRNLPLWAIPRGLSRVARPAWRAREVNGRRICVDDWRVVWVWLVGLLHGGSDRSWGIRCAQARARQPDPNSLALRVIEHSGRLSLCMVKVNTGILTEREPKQPLTSLASWTSTLPMILCSHPLCTLLSRSRTSDARAFSCSP